MITDHPQLLAGRYRVGDALGSGGMGTVYAAHDERLDRPVAIKVLRPDLAEDPSLRRRFEREARSAARITHPHAVAVYDTGEDSTHDTFIVMELLSGQTLAHELVEGSLDERRLREIADDVLGALGAAHAEGIVHRDVKPGNILLADDGSVKISDFGIATTLDAGETTTAVPLGTPAYTAPERLRGLAATERSDLYSLAVVLYEAAAGARPFTGDGPAAVAEAVVGGAHAPLRTRRTDLSAHFVDAVERGLAVDPTARFASADEMRAALASPPFTEPAPPEPATVPVTVTVPPTAVRETAALPTRATPSHVPAPARVREPRRRFSRAWAIAVAALVIVVFVVVLVAHGEDTPTTTPPASSAPAPTAAPAAGPQATNLPGPLEHAVDHLEEVTQP